MTRVSICLLPLWLVACAPLAARTEVTPAAAVSPAAEKHPGMNALIAEMAPEDAARRAALTELMQAAEYQQAIIDAISRPAEAKPWHQYRPIFMTDERIRQGLAFWREHRELLQTVETEFQVPAEYIVSIVGVETFYGRVTGRWKVLDALTTLGLYYPPRQAYFRGELMRFLDLPKTRGIEIDQRKVTGSYAGAMGLGQFMPTSFVKWAVDQDDDGQIDLWNSRADALASVANYLKDHGWAYGERVTVPMVPGPNAKAWSDPGLDPVYTVGTLVEWGYQPEIVLAPETPASLLRLEVASGEYEYHAIFPNFRVITRYNRSPLYAMAVHELALALRAGMDTPAVAGSAP